MSKYLYGSAALLLIASSLFVLNGQQSSTGAQQKELLRWNDTTAKELPDVYYDTVLEAQLESELMRGGFTFARRIEQGRFSLFTKERLWASLEQVIPDTMAIKESLLPAGHPSFAPLIRFQFGRGDTPVRFVPPPVEDEEKEPKTLPSCFCSCGEHFGCSDRISMNAAYVLDVTERHLGDSSKMDRHFGRAGMRILEKRNKETWRACYTPRWWGFDYLVYREGRVHVTGTDSLFAVEPALLAKGYGATPQPDGSVTYRKGTHCVHLSPLPDGKYNVSIYRALPCLPDDILVTEAKGRAAGAQQLDFFPQPVPKKLTEH